MKKAVFIYNPNSGKKTKKKIKQVADFSKIEKIFNEHNYDVEFIETEYAGHAKEIVKNLKPVDLVISVGGDGTYNETMSGNFLRKEKLVLSHLPYGTTNDIGTMFGLGKNLYKNIELILTGEVKEIDICTVNGQPFTYSAGFGIFMNIPYETKRSLKKKIGHAAYILKAVKDFIIYKAHLYEASYEVNGEKYHGLYSFCLISNANRVAGIKFYNDVKLNDNRFEVLFCNIRKRKNIVKSFLYLTTKGDIAKVPGFYFHKTDKLKITFHEKLKKPWCVDGEKYEIEKNTYIIENVRGIKVMIPKKVIPQLFVGEKND